MTARRTSDSPTLFDMPLKPDFSFERRAIDRGQWPIAGLDEAGRGPLAGPVVAAAVVLDPEAVPEGLDDSKRLTAAQREILFRDILDLATGVAFSAVCADTIDASDIRKASLEAMRRAASGLTLAPKFALVDGRDIPPGLPCQATALVKGDRRSQSIAAASVVAKVMRDRIMVRTGSVYPEYGFEQHKGYGTAAHREAAEREGCAHRLHRRSFAPFRGSSVAQASN
jgi:ribonuclease HII